MKRSGKIKIFYLCLFIFWSLFAFCGNPLIDSLEKQLESRTEMALKQRCDLLNQLSKSYLRIAPQKALDYGKEALSIAEKTGDKQAVASAFKNIGSACYVQSDYAQALEHYKQALRINLELNNAEEIAAGYNNLGLVYNNLGYYEEALKNHLLQLKINEEIQNLKGSAIAYRNIGNIYNKMDENDKAIEYYEKARIISEKLADTNSVATALINLGVVCIPMKNFDRALEYFNKALKIKEKSGDIGNIAIIYLNLGVIYANLAQYRQAIDYYEKAFALYQNLHNKEGIAITILNLGKAEMRLKNYPGSLNYLHNALDIANEIDSKKTIKDIYTLLSEWYSEKGDYKSALEFYKKQSDLQDSLLNTEKSKQIRNLQIVYEVEKKEKEILQQNVSIQKLKNSQIILGLVILVALTIAFIAYYLFRLKQKANRNLEIRIAEALQKQNEQQQIIVHQASLTSLGELAAGIAHEIKQPLQNISLANESLDIELKESTPDLKFMTDTVKEIYEDIKRIKFIIAEITNFSRGQQQSLQEDFDVNTCIRNALSLARTKFSNRQIEVILNLSDNLPQISGNPYKFEQVIVNLFNNAKDAIEEKVEKSDEKFDKKMIVRSWLEGQNIIIEVSDNGIGVPDAIKTNIFLPFYTTKTIGKGTGLGLSISLGIIKEMKGFIDVESKEMTGTTMRVKIPVNNQ